MHLIILHGYPGVGKLTIGAKLADLVDYRLFHNHLAVDYASSVFDFGTPEFIELREKAWLDMFRAAVLHQVKGMVFSLPQRLGTPESNPRILL